MPRGKGGKEQVKGRRDEPMRKDEGRNEAQVAAGGGSRLTRRK